jgi:hypothetical protein
MLLLFDFIHGARKTQTSQRDHCYQLVVRAQDTRSMFYIGSKSFLPVDALRQGNRPAAKIWRVKSSRTIAFS